MKPWKVLNFEFESIHMSACEQAALPQLVPWGGCGVRSDIHFDPRRSFILNHPVSDRIFFVSAFVRSNNHL